MAIAASLSALKAGADAFKAIGNNVANTNTVGYKGEKATFSTTLAGTSYPETFISGGVVAKNVRQTDQQGLMQRSNNTTDVAIGGNGFFVVSKTAVLQPGQTGSEIGYTRAGQFQPDKDGYLKNSANGQFLLGWETDGTGVPMQPVTGTLSSLESIKVNKNTSLTRQTTQVALSLNLPSVETISGAATHTTSIQIYDSLGQPHTMSIDWEKTSMNPNTWTATITSPDGTITKDTPTGAAYANMSVVFDGDGQPVSFDGVGGANASPPAVAIVWAGNSAAANNSTIALNLGAVGTRTGATCISGNFEETKSYQDGKEVGKLSGVSINDDGLVTAIYTNGEALAIYKIALAGFAAPNALGAKIGNVFLQTDLSGKFTLGSANQSGLGSIKSNSLEESTVELADELTNMMSVQRFYSSNTQVIRADENMFKALEQNLRS